MNDFRRLLTVTVMAVATAFASGCAVLRDQATPGAYIDDKVIVATVKAKLLEDRAVGGMSVNVDALNGTVALSGFAKSEAEKARAESLARNTRGVKDVRNNLIVRP